jgi:hypothetical protein
MKKMLTALSFMFYVITASSQNLASMPQEKRDSLLISIAKEVIMKYGPDYYREYKRPTITKGKVPPRGSLNPDGKNAGKSFYLLIFPYDNTLEELEWDYAAKVSIWEDNGKPSGVYFGTGYGMKVSEKVMQGKESITPIPYQQVNLFPIYDWQNGKDETNSQPVNLDKLIKRGYQKGADGQWKKLTKDVPPRY